MDNFLFQTLSILGSIGFVVAGILAVLELRDYYQKLQLLVTYLDCQPVGNETSLVLFRLSFVNHSSRTRVVYDVDVISRGSGIHLIDMNEEADSNLRTVTYSLPNVFRQLPFDETLLFPLDIPPHQSLSRWKAIAVSYYGIAPFSGTMVRFEAIAPKGKGKWSGGIGVLFGGMQEYQGTGRKVLADEEIVLFPAKAQSRTRNIFREL